MEWDNGSSSYLSFEEPSDQTIEDAGVEEQIVSSHQNDMFHAGDTLTISLLYTDGQEQYDDEYNIVLPKDAVKIDKTVTIGAVLNLPDDDELSRLVTMYTSEFLNVVTTSGGLSALGFEVPYSSLTVELSETPDAQTADALHAALEQISSHIPGGQLNSGLERAEENRGLAVELTAIVIAICVLMVALTASMMINTLFCAYSVKPAKHRNATRCRRFKTGNLSDLSISGVVAVCVGRRHRVYSECCDWVLV